MLKIRYGNIIDPATLSPWEGVASLLEFKPKGAFLSWDLTILKEELKSIISAFSNRSNKILEENSELLEYEDEEGNKKQTPFQLNEKGVPSNKYNLKDIAKTVHEINKIINDIITLESNMLKLSDFKSEDSSALNFEHLRPFIIDDRK